MKYPSEEILEKIANNSLSKVEEKKIEDWLLKSDKNQDLLKLLLSEYFLSRSNDSEKAFNNFSNSNKSSESKIVKLNSYRLGIAASIILLIGVFFFYKMLVKNPEQNIQGLVLVTEDGDKINLDEVNKSKFSLSNITIDKAKNLLNYKNVESKGEVKYNTLHVPNGRTFKLILSDGTAVSLNSGTKFTYPTYFDTNKRMVKLEGEAYFEVISDKKAPFIVQTSQVKTQVFGTKFNINAYENNDTQNISLLEGSIGVLPTANIKKIGLKIIKPNQQYIWDQSVERYNVKRVDASKFIDWVDGVLRFENESLENIIKRLERKYDIEIVCNNEDMNNKRFTGIFKGETLNQVLTLIRATNSFEYKLDENLNKLVIE